MDLTVKTSRSSYKVTANGLTLTVSRGNMKTGRIMALSLPPIQSCIDNPPCAKTCYAMKAIRLYPNCRKAWGDNLRLWDQNVNDFLLSLHAILKKTRPTFFRWHVAGDIVSPRYLAMMRIIAELHPKTKFLAFTKRYEYDYSDLPENLCIVFSAWPGLDMPSVKGISVAYMRDEKDLDKRIPDDALECPGNCETCGACWGLSKKGIDVAFNKH